jgi:hypothetical protein
MRNNSVLFRSFLVFFNNFFKAAKKRPGPRGRWGQSASPDRPG